MRQPEKRRSRPTLRASALALVLLAPLLLTGCRWRQEGGREPEPVALPAELRLAEEAFARREFVAARERYLLYHATHPQTRWSAFILCRLGECFLGEGNPSQAETLFQQALAREPDEVVRARTVLGLADIEFDRRKFASAREGYALLWDEKKEALRVAVPEDHVLFRLGKCAWELDDRAAADRCFALLLARHPRSPYAATAAELHRPTYVVHAGEFRQHEDAEARARQVRAMALNAELIPFERAGAFWLRVRLGRYRTRVEAEQVVARLAGRKIDGFVLEEAR